MATDYGIVMNDRRIGRFRISRNFLLDSPNLVHTILSNVLVMETNTDWVSDAQEYKAFSEVFDSLLDGEVIPEYRVEIFGDQEYQFRRIH